MYCRNCGAQIRDGAEFCVKCGCRPLNGKEYCQECGAETTERQEMCVECGYMLRTGFGKSRGFFYDTNTTYNTTGSTNLNFSALSSFYQREFSRIYQSNEQYKGRFNVCAFLFGVLWAFTKGCWLSALIAIVLSIFTAGLAGVAYWFIYGFRGTYMYYCSYVKDEQKIF